MPRQRWVYRDEQSKKIGSMNDHGLLFCYPWLDHIGFEQTGVETRFREKYIYPFVLGARAR